MNDNEFEYDGKTYVAVESKVGDTCRRCAFAKVNCYKLMHSGKIPPCITPGRKDGRDVRFIEKGA